MGYDPLCPLRCQGMAQGDSEQRQGCVLGRVLQRLWGHGRRALEPAALTLPLEAKDLVGAFCGRSQNGTTQNALNHPIRGLVSRARSEGGKYGGVTRSAPITTLEAFCA